MSDELFPEGEDIKESSKAPSSSASSNPVASVASVIPSPIRDGSQVLRHDGFDVQEFRDACKMFGKLGELVKNSQQRLTTSRALIMDLFLSFFKAAPEIEPVAPLTPAHEINHRIITEILSTVEWQQLRQAGTVNDQLNAAMATIGAAGRALAALDQVTVDQINRLHETESGAAEMFARAEALDDLAAQAAGDRAATLFAQAEEARREAEAKQAEAQHLQAELEADVEDIEDATRRAGRRGMKAAEAEIDAMNEAVQTFAGGYGPGAEPADPMTTKDKIRLAREVGKSQRLKQMAQICGRITRIALQTQYAKVSHPPDEITSIGIGNDLGRVLPSEIALLTDPVLEDLFFLRYAEGRLMQYQLIGNEKQGQGPIIVALDSSGSMEAEFGGATREVWSKAVTLAFLAISRLQKRDMVVIHFSDGHQLSIHRFEKGKANYSEVIACVDLFYKGGTDYEPWMRESMRIIGEAQFNRADVIILSDGEPNYFDNRMCSEWNRQRQARDTRCYAVLLGEVEYAPTLAKLSDALLTLDNMQADLPVLETIFNV